MGKERLAKMREMQNERDFWEKIALGEWLYHLMPFSIEEGDASVPFQKCASHFTNKILPDLYSVPCAKKILKKDCLLCDVAWEFKELCDELGKKASKKDEMLSSMYSNPRVAVIAVRIKEDPKTKEYTIIEPRPYQLPGKKLWNHIWEFMESRDADASDLFSGHWITIKKTIGDSKDERDVQYNVSTERGASSIFDDFGITKKMVKQWYNEEIPAILAHEDWQKAFTPPSLEVQEKIVKRLRAWRLKAVDEEEEVEKEETGRPPRKNKSMDDEEPPKKKSTKQLLDEEEEEPPKKKSTKQLLDEEEEEPPKKTRKVDIAEIEELDPKEKTALDDFMKKLKEERNTKNED